MSNKHPLRERYEKLFERDVQTKIVESRVVDQYFADGEYVDGTGYFEGNFASFEEMKKRIEDFGDNDLNKDSITYYVRYNDGHEEEIEDGSGYPNSGYEHEGNIEEENLEEASEGTDDPALQEVADIIQGKDLFQMKDELEGHGYVCSFTDLAPNAGYVLEAVKHGQEPIVIASDSTLKYESGNGMLADGKYVVKFLN